MNSFILQKQEEVIALAQFDIKDAVLKKCLLKEDETVITVPDGVTPSGIFYAILPEGRTWQMQKT